MATVGNVRLPIQKYSNEAIARAHAFQDRIEKIQDLFNGVLPIGPDTEPIARLLDKLYQAKAKVLRDEPIDDDFFTDPECQQYEHIEWVDVDSGTTSGLAPRDTGTGRGESLLDVQSLSNRIDGSERHIGDESWNVHHPRRGVQRQRSSSRITNTDKHGRHLSLGRI